MQGKFRLVLAAVLAFALAASVMAVGGCTPKNEGGGGSQQSEQPQKGGTMSFYVGNPAYIDPYNTQESEGTQIEQTVFDSLTAFDPLNPEKVIPAAAESWQSNSDGTVWTFKLRQDGQFSDGTPVTANDFIYAWNRIANPKTVNTSTGKPDPSIISYHLAAVKGWDEMQAGKIPAMTGLKAVDDYTLEVTLAKPFADFEYVVAHPALAPVPQKLVEGGVDFNGKKVPFGEMPVGNGPFKLSEPWKADQYVKVVRNDNYKNGAVPYIDGIDFMIFKDPETAYTEFTAGNLDFTQIGEGKITQAKEQYGVSDNGYTANPGKQVLLGAENSTYYMIFNLDDKAMANKDLRKALTLGINRQAICDVVFEGTREPADNIVPPGIAGYEAGQWADSKYDKAAAEQALTAAGFPGGKGAPTIAISFNNDGGHEKIMELVKADYEALGLKVEFDSADFPTYLKQLDSKKFMMGRLGWVADYPIMDNFLFPLFQSESSDNKSAYKNPQVDTALSEARATTDGAERIKKYQDINATIQADNPVAPVMFYKHHHVASDRVHNFTYSAMNLGDFQSVWLSGGTATQ